MPKKRSLMSLQLQYHVNLLTIYPVPFGQKKSKQKSNYPK